MALRRNSRVYVITLLALALARMSAFTAGRLPARRIRHSAFHARGHVRASGEGLYDREPMVLTWENAERVVREAQEDLGTMFGSSQENIDIGITGALELVDVDGPVVVVRLSGTFWHSDERVKPRVESYIRQRIPECVEVEFAPELELGEDSTAPMFA